MSTWEAPALPSRWAGGVGPTFVGRRRELEVLEEAWAAVTRGSRQVVFVGGEAGGGKSRLIQVAATALHAEGAAVLLGRGIADLSTPYEPFVEPLTTLQDALARGELTPNAPFTTEQLVDRLTTVLGAGQPDPEARGRIAVYEAVAGVLRCAAAARPVVLVLEDLQWAGASTLELLTFVGERSSGSRLLVLASHRSLPPDRSEAVADTIAAMYRTDGVRRLDLGPLDVEDIAEYVVRETRTAPHRARPLAARLRDTTGGNAFYLRELVRDLAEGQQHGNDLRAVGTAGVRVPPSVREVFLRRVARLDESGRHLVEVAAVVGDTFSLALVAASAGLPREDALDGVDALVGTGLVLPEATDPDDFRFVHALARAAVLGSMAASVLTRRHAEVASRLEHDFPAAPHRVQRLAHHYAAAHVLGYDEEAVHYLELAADDARRRMAHLEAGQLLERAALLAHDAVRRDDLRLRAAEAHRDGGNLAAAYDLARQVADDGSPVDRLRAAIVFEGASWRVGRSGEGAVALLTRALADEPVEALHPLAVRGRASLSRALVFSGEPDRAEVLGEQAVQEARALGDPHTLAHALETVVMVLPRPRRAETQWDRACELSEVAQRSGDADHAVQGASIRIMLAYLLGRRAELDRARADLGEASRLTGSAFHRMEFFTYEFARCFAEGRLRDAEELSRHLAELGDRFVAADFEGAVALQGFLLRRERDRVEEVRPFVRGDEGTDERWAPGLLALYCELEMQEPARRVLAWLTDHLAQYDGSSTWPATLCFLADAVVSLKDVAAARVVLARLEEYAGAHLAVGPLCVVFGSADRYRGRIASMLDHPDADDVLAAAVEQEREMGATLFLAYALVARAAHLRRAERRSVEARVLVDEARELVGGLELPRLHRLIGDSSEPFPAGLTSREVEVLRLLGQGASNRDLARRLFISENTATNHVRSILLKTGSTNRTQAALYASTHGLIE